MCLTTKKTFRTVTEAKKQKPQIASRNIIVYKRLVIRSGGSPYLVSPYQGTKYKSNELKKSRIGKSGYCIGEVVQNKISIGLHAYVTLTEAERMAEFGETIVKCIIPKGAKYFIGDDYDIASNKLYVTNVCLTGVNSSLKELGFIFKTENQSRKLRHKI